MSPSNFHKHMHGYVPAHAHTHNNNNKQQKCFPSCGGLIPDLYDEQ